MVTSRKRSVTSAGSGQPQGWSLVVQVSGGARRAQAASPRQATTNLKFSGKQGRHNFSSGALAPLFFLHHCFHVIASTSVLLRQCFYVIARSPCDEAIHFPHTHLRPRWIASLRSQ